MFMSERTIVINGEETGKQKFLERVRLNPRVMAWLLSPPKDSSLDYILGQMDSAFYNMEESFILNKRKVLLIENVYDLSILEKLKDIFGIFEIFFSNKKQDILKHDIVINQDKDTFEEEVDNKLRILIKEN